MSRRSFVVATTIILTLALATVAIAAEPYVGTWKLNVAKSKINIGPWIKSSTVTITAQDNGIWLVDDIVDADGKAIHVDFTAKYDGKDYSITGAPDEDTVALNRIDTKTWTEVLKKAGKQAQRSGRITISKDGMTMTHTTKEKNDKGQNFINTFVWDRQ